jgi:hypothetical protein
MQRSLVSKRDGRTGAGAGRGAMRLSWLGLLAASVLAGSACSTPHLSERSGEAFCRVFRQQVVQPLAAAEQPEAMSGADADLLLFNTRPPRRASNEGQARQGSTVSLMPIQR